MITYSADCTKSRTYTDNPIETHYTNMKYTALWCAKNVAFSSLASAHLTGALVANRRSQNRLEVQTENWNCVIKTNINIYFCAQADLTCNIINYSSSTYSEPLRPIQSSILFSGMGKIKSHDSTLLHEVMWEKVECVLENGRMDVQG